MRLRLWLFALDVVFALGGYGSRLYYWVLERASDATDWGSDERGEDT